MRKIFLTLALTLVPLPLCAQTNPRATLTTVPFDSQLLHAKAPLNIILPVGYEDGITRYPVLLLLHGLTDHYNAWVSATNIVRYATKYPLIIVMPEGGNGWYTNGVAPNAKWEDHIIQEVIPYMDARYRTLHDQQLWAVAGLSMGGYGAMKLGLKYREQFSFADSMSGALDAPEFKDADLATGSVVRTSAHDAFGPEGSPARKANTLATPLDASHHPFHLSISIAVRRMACSAPAGSFRSCCYPGKFRTNSASARAFMIGSNGTIKSKVFCSF